MAAWDNIRMAQQFMRRSNALNPDQAREEGRYEEELAHQELLDECYMSSFSKTQLLEMLQNSIKGKVKMPEDLPEGTEFDAAKYTSAYVALAKNMLNEIEKAG